MIRGRVEQHNRQQLGKMIGALAFQLLGATDQLEIAREGKQPLWLWGLKISAVS